MEDYAIEVKNVSLEFCLYSENVSSIKGEAVGLVGKNGCGKSTMLKTIAGVLTPTMGTVKVNGTVAPMIELGAGFDPELTARENIFLNGAILGYPQEMLKERFDEIIDFAELKDFVDVPVKNFSSGMTTRLGFSIATIYTPDILIVDEILAVGDFAFQKKCEKRIGDMLNSGTTLLLVSHSTEQVRRICDRAVLINKGKMLIEDDVDTVCDLYTHL